ncbi:MAG: autotransporter-associated beta strand repeat-containing protein, partial [Planctomycetaceae bacterium]|nr:autotransporter-associated beta strand repeat-containing protein [Planctomycetaceae bacterium]
MHNSSKTTLRTFLNRLFQTSFRSRRKPRRLALPAEVLEERIMLTSFTTFDFESGVTFNGRTVKQAHPTANETLVATATNDNPQSSNFLGSAAVEVGSNAFESSVTFSLESGKIFDFNSIGIIIFDGPTDYTLTTSKGSANFSASLFTGTTFDTTGNSDFQGVTSVTLSASVTFDLEFDNVVLDNIASSNTAPVIGNLDANTVSHAGIGNTVTLDSGSDATVTDVELDALNGGNGDYSGATLTVQRSGTALASDTFGFDTSGASFTVSGSNLQSGGQTFASFTNSNGVLTITFNSSGTIATKALVGDVARHITYRNDTPFGDADINFTLTDPENDSDTATVTVESDLVYVTTSADQSDNVLSDGVSLREALTIASNQTGVQTIVFDSSLSSGTITLGSSATVEAGATFQFDTNNLTITGSQLQLDGSLTTGIGSGNTNTLASNLVNGTGTGSVIKSGAGTLVLSGTNTYTGGTTVNGGTLSFSSGANFGTGNITLGEGTTLQVTNSSQTITNNVVFTGNATINTPFVVTFSGAFSGGAHTLTKAGGGTLRLTNTNNESGLTGGVIVTGGALSVTEDDSLFGGTVTFNGGAGISINSATTIDNNFVLNNNATISANSSATLSGTIS